MEILPPILRAAFLGHVPLDGHEFQHGLLGHGFSSRVNWLRRFTALPFGLKVINYDLL
jgi:hypothetical protein